MRFGKRTALLAVIMIASRLNVEAAAQISDKSSYPITSAARATALHEQAVALHAQPIRSADAARLHLQSAALRPTSDPQAVECLAMAAHLFNYAKRPLQARRTMESAAERALSTGDVKRAAQAYIEAAFLANKQDITSPYDGTRTTKWLPRRIACGPSWRGWNGAWAASLLLYS